MFLDRPAGYFTVSALFHLLYCLCALDVYYRSPFQDIGGLEAHRSTLPPLAKRVVFVTLDGAPADVVMTAMRKDMIAERDSGAAAADNVNVTAPFLASLFGEDAGVCWGVTHTHVPTESRPGHISLIAGFYEDPSAVKTGWEANVDMSFDTVWKEATWVWQWGAPEIVGIFAGGGHIETRAFPPELNDYAEDPRQVDTWVVDNMTHFFHGASKNETLAARLRSERVVFFLHFLGMDSAGHKFGTGGTGYLESMAHVDKCLRDASRVLDEFYGHDNETVYVITADHGMTRRGSHGDGSPEETRVPIIAYGAGLNPRCRERRGAPPSGVKFWQEAFSSLEEEVAYTRRRWAGAPSERIDLEPADVSILMASLLSSPLPVHSEGTVPLEYLAEDPAVRAHAAFTNLRQARTRVEGAADLRQERSKGWFTPWPQTEATEEAFQKFESDLASGEYSALLHGGAFETLIERYREGSVYYREYDRLFMTLAVGFAYVTWVLYSASMVTPKRTFRLHHFVPFAVGWAVVLPLVAVQGMTVRDGAYLIAPFFLLPFVVRQAPEVATMFRQELTWAQGLAAGGAVLAVGVGFQHRAMFSAALLAAAFALLVKGGDEGPTVVALAGCAVFTVLPCVGSDFVVLVAPSGLLLGGGALVVTRALRVPGFAVPTALVIFSSLLVAISDYLRNHGGGLPVINQALGWGVLVVSLVLPRLAAPAPSTHRLAYVLLCLHAPLILLSVGYEPLFMTALSALLLVVETRARRVRRLTITAQGTLLMFLVYFAFFATGNIASISSFDLPSVYRLQTQFDKGIMGVLLVFKLWIPLLAVCTTVLIINNYAVGKVFAVVAAAVGLSDIVALVFFATLRTSGSWKEIGHSISRFVIANLLTLILLILWGLSALYSKPAKSKRASD
eukprot:TRINITY_DN8922_c0_g2_i1.p1 TRINITY_DN8922_c0_g2~~TRINITY_DN8922_c0_g2_i1.p1  ORF type:complete len:902 (+),score=249.44 TRINITY_DN8922_c0_g2_i1:129-2834(+)